MLSFFALIVAMFITMMLIPPLMKSAQRYSFVDMPNERKVHTTPVPRIGGVAMVAGAVTPILLWIEPSHQVLSLLYGMGVILFFGVWDDRVGLDFRIKFLGQLIAVGVAVFYGDVVIRQVPFHSFEPIPDYLAVPLSIFALLGITNAINLADGLDGLAGGTTLLSIGMVSLLAYTMHDAALFVMAMAVMGSIIGFLRYNTYPAQIFMGDGGSQFLGFATGVLVILLTQKSGAVLSPAMPLLLLGLPLMDTFLVMGQRIYEGRSPFQPDKNHVHHKLLHLGFDHYEAVVIIYSLQAVLVMLAYVLRYRADALNLGAFAIAFAGLWGVFRIANQRGLRAQLARVAERPSPLSRLANGLKRSGMLGRVPVLVACITIPVYCTIGILATTEFPNDAPLTANILLVATLAQLVLLRRQPVFLLIERLTLYVTLTTLVFYTERGLVHGTWVSHLDATYFGLLGLLLLMTYRFTRNRTFNVTPTDFLVIVIALIVSSLSASIFPQNNISEIAIKVLILFYAAELIVSHARENLWLLRVISASIVGVLALRVAMAF